MKQLNDGYIFSRGLFWLIKQKMILHNDNIFIQWWWFWYKLDTVKLILYISSFFHILTAGKCCVIQDIWEKSAIKLEILNMMKLKLNCCCSSWNKKCQKWWNFSSLSQIKYLFISLLINNYSSLKLSWIFLDSLEEALKSDEKIKETIKKNKRRSTGHGTAGKEFLACNFWN